MIPFVCSEGGTVRALQENCDKGTEKILHLQLLRKKRTFYSEPTSPTNLFPKYIHTRTRAWAYRVCQKVGWQGWQSPRLITNYKLSSSLLFPRPYPVDMFKFPYSCFICTFGKKYVPLLPK